MAKKVKNMSDADLLSGVRTLTHYGDWSLGLTLAFMTIACITTFILSFVDGDKMESNAPTDQTNKMVIQFKNLRIPSVVTLVVSWIVILMLWKYTSVKIVFGSRLLYSLVILFFVVTMAVGYAISAAI